MAYGKRRYSKKPFENAERYRYKTLLGKTRDIYCSGEPVPESALDLICDLIPPIGVMIGSIAAAVISLRGAGASAHLFQTSFAERLIVAAVGSLAILIFAGYSFRRIRRYMISRRKYIRVSGIAAEEKLEYKFTEKGRKRNE